MPGSQRHAAIYGVSDLSKAIPTNTAASAKQRLLNRARAKKEDFNLLLTKYALERVLYRISQSPHRDTFVPFAAHTCLELCHPILEQPNRINADPYHITVGKREVVTRNNADACHEKNTVRKCIVTEQVPDQLFGVPF